MQTIIIAAPARAGKTRNATALAKAFGCQQIVDNWDGYSAIPSGALVLTNVEHPKIPRGARWVSWAQAMHALA
ncbi:hypothetical protein AAIH29_21385 [Pseudomonas aeruginosa]|uniref:hypothetical protein n=1 Tax=Pseudomonas aeruginosa TaxID=287 RepID=UPI0031B73129